MSQTGKSNGVLSVVLTSIVLAGVLSLTGLAQGNTKEQGQGPVSLSAGVLIDPQGTAYFPDPEGAIVAVRLDSGAQLWKTPAGKSYRPLAITGKFLVAVQEGGGPKTGTYLGVVLFQRQDGSEQAINWAELPSDAWTSVKDGLGSSLRTNATVGLDGKVTIAWVSERQPEVRGIADEDEDEDLDAGAKQTRTVRTELEVHSGTIVIDPGGQILPLGRAVVSSTQMLQPARQDLPDGQRLKGLPQAQFASSDLKHVLASEMTGNDRDMNKYRWTIYSGATSEPLGTIASPFPTAPFFVSGSTLFYQLRPFMVRDSSDQMVRSPLKLVAIDLRTGSKLWEYPVLDPQYYGPFPQ